MAPQSSHVHATPVKTNPFVQTKDPLPHPRSPPRRPEKSTYSKHRHRQASRSTRSTSLRLRSRTRSPSLACPDPQRSHKDHYQDSTCQPQSSPYKDQCQDWTSQCQSSSQDDYQHGVVHHTLLQQTPGSTLQWKIWLSGSLASLRPL